MNFTEEEKKEICGLFRSKTVEEVSELKGISVDVLTPLKEEYDSTVGPLDLEYRDFKMAIRDGYSLEKLERLQQQYSKNQKVQSAIVTKYIKIGAWDKAISICINHSGHVIFDSQYVKILMKLYRFREAIVICEKYPNDEEFQKKLQQIKSIILKRNIEGNCSVHEDVTLDIQESDALEDNILNVEEVNADTEENNILGVIREKLSNNTFENEDLLLLKDLEGKIDDTTYKFILIAVYHRRGTIKSALQVLKTIDPEYKKIQNKILTLLSNKKSVQVYDLGFYDELICWRGSTQNIEEKAVVKAKRAKIIDEA